MDNHSIVVNCPENMPEEIVQDLVGGVDPKIFELEVKKTPLGVYNAFEWAIPGIIAAYIAKPFFESFLKKAGEDSYTYFKSWLKNLVTKSRLIKVHSLAASKSTDKLDPMYNQSKAISVYCQTSNGHVIKLLFDERLPDQDLENAIDEILELLKENYSNPMDNELNRKTENLNKKYKTLYAFIDRDSKEWVFKDDQELIQSRILSKTKNEDDQTPI